MIENIRTIIRSIYNYDEYNLKSFPNLEMILIDYSNKYKISEDKLKHELLLNNIAKKEPYLLIHIFDNVINLILQRFIFNKYDISDIKQDMIVELLEKRIDSVLKNYRQDVSFVSYFSKVLINLCLSKQREYCLKRISTTEEVDTLPFYSEEGASEFGNQIILDFKRLVENAYNFKMILVFKTINHHKIIKIELVIPFPLLSNWDSNKYLTLFNKINKNKLENLTILFNKYERKRIKSQSLMRLLNLYIDQLGRIFNEFNEISYNNSDIKELFNYCLENEVIEIPVKHEKKQNS
jgi:hypothetical protein